MRAAVCRELGPPGTLSIEELPDPVPAPGQVVIDVGAAGVNYVDALFIRGQYQIKPPLPFIPGSEIAGVVSDVGADVTNLQPGARVLASMGLGGFASKVVAAADAVSPVPAVLDAPRAATFCQSYCTALYALRQRGHLATDEAVLVLGAGGGVGLAAIDVTVALGARAIGAASSAAKRDAALSAGAAEVIDSSSEPLKERARQLAGGGVDVVVDPVGGDLAEGALRALGERGRYLVIGFASGSIPALPLNQVLLRNRSVVGVDWGAWAMAHGEHQRALLRELLELVGRGRLRPVVPTVYPLDRVGLALDDLEHRRVVGKAAVVP